MQRKYALEQVLTILHGLESDFRTWPGPDSSGRCCVPNANEPCSFRLIMRRDDVLEDTLPG